MHVVVWGTELRAPSGREQDDVAGLDWLWRSLEVRDRNRLAAGPLHGHDDGRPAQIVERDLFDGPAVRHEVPWCIDVGARVRGDSSSSEMLSGCPWSIRRIG